MSPEYTNDHVGLLNRFEQIADEHAAKAAGWFSELAKAKAEAATASERFLSDFAPANARDLAAAEARVRDLSTVTAAIAEAGGPDGARVRSLSTAAVFSAFAKAFAERVNDLERLRPPARKRLGLRRSELTEAGVHALLIERDPLVHALCEFDRAVVTQIAAATFGATYANARGANYEPRSFDALLADVTAPLPQPPPVPAGS